MSEIKNKKVKEQKKTLTIIFSVTAMLFFILSFLVKSEELKIGFLCITMTLVIANIISRFFPDGFGYKPTLDEIEEMQFGKKGEIK